MPITLAGPLGNHPGMNGSPRYKASTPQMAPEEKSAADMIKEQASSTAMEAGTEAAQEAGTEYIVDPLKAKAKEMWTGFTAPATAPSSSFMPAALPSELTGPMMSGSQTATADALLSSGMTGAEAMAGAGSLAPAAASTAAPAVASTVAPTVAATAAPAVAGPMAAMMASPLAPLAIGALAGKAFGLFDKGGPVEPSYANMGGLMPMLMEKAKEKGIPMGLASLLYQGGPVSKVKYAQSGGPVDEKIEVSYRGPLAGN
jgi:hypothetical protein